MSTTVRVSLSIVKRRSLIAAILLLLVIVSFPLLASSCFTWQRDVSIRGVPFQRVRIEKNGLAIGRIEDDMMIGGRPCRKGWVQLHTNGMPAAFTAADEIQLPALRIPRGTWVIQDPNGIVSICAFPGDTEVQGHLCRGSGGPAGVQASFYPSGRLKQFYLRDDTTIQDIPCKSGVLGNSIELHENGQLKTCTLGKSITRDGKPYQKGKRVQIDAQGRILQ